MGRVDLSDDEIATLDAIRGKTAHPERGLPEAVFGFALHMVPMINVDLVVPRGDGEVLWAWRDDAFGCGWHIPGSIIRVGEAIADRIARTAEDELSANVVAEDAPRAIVQFFSRRGTFISLVYRCRLSPGTAVATASEPDRPQPSDLHWFGEMPEPVYPVHACYRDLLPVFLDAKAGPPMMLTVNE